MKQILQNMRTGELTVAEVPAPALRGPGALVQTCCSLISAGTEKGVMDLARKSLLGKAKDRPDLVRQFVAKVKRDGLRAALATAMARLDQPLLQGYSSVGQVLATSGDVAGVGAGDRVACGGGGYASHAGVVYVPRNLLARVPDGVRDEAACFACVGAVAMQAARVGRPELGERVVVIGLGLIGQILQQILRANGCRVLGCDPDGRRRALAESLGLDAGCGPDDVVRRCDTFTAGRGADAVFITAATSDNTPLAQAIEISRRRGRVVGVGDFGMTIPRKPFYERELELRMSMAYGPGRYDADYEERGIDYPHAYVPWTEQRNMAAVVDLIAQGKLDVEALITHRFEIDQAERAYAALGDDVPPDQRGMGVILTYPAEQAPSRRLDLTPGPVEGRGVGDRVRIGVVGAGQYASGVLLPLLAKMEGVELVGLAAATGPSAEHAGRKFGVGFCTTDYGELLSDASIDLIVVATRHDLHPVIAVEALRAGKHVFVEKPLAITEDGLADVLTAQRQSGRMVMVGFNRRFAPLTRRALEHIGSSHGPLTITYRCNAGMLPTDHWLYDPEQGGGRIIGEACHFVDLAIFLDGSLPTRIYAESTGGVAGERLAEDTCVITLRLASGSVAQVVYAAGGDASFSKERIEVLGDGRVFVIEDFRTAQAVRNGVQRTIKLRQDKGQRPMLEATLHAVRQGQPSPIPLDQSLATTLTTLRATQTQSTATPLPLFGNATNE
jgi:predicted dehydrogenase/threonine dehydrogenase-like Zn-dependent dehydrogenase